MTLANVIFPLAMLAAAGCLGWIIYLAVRGAPGVVSWAPPEGSSRVPVYAFFGTWFAAGLAGRSIDGLGRGFLWIRFAMLLIALAAGFVSYRRLRQNPPLPPRI